MIYLDNAATTRPSTAAMAAFDASRNIFGNPSSLHSIGMAAEKELAKAREVLAKIINASPSEIFFTASGTEANNLALFGGAKKHKGKRIVTSANEHSSVKEPLNKLSSKDGFEIHYLQKDGLQDALAEQTCLVAIHHVNSETGEIQDICAMGSEIKRTSPATLFHVDAIQSFCKIPIDVKKMQVDMLSMSAHKIGGFKGSGALYVRNGVALSPMILGGGQEGGLRSGTENVTGIMTFAASAEDFWKNTKAHNDHASALKSRFLQALGGVDGISTNGENTSPYILNISVAGVRSQVLLNALSDKGVYISSGAACSNNKRQKKADEHAVRISFSHENTAEEIDTAIALFIESINSLRMTKYV
ncbi:MAG: cysteine desulfurase [Defluviitaleaceae bacterium]|nr:cysteine desulfurase [Defluviitaleaceae bacterium]